MPRKRLFRLLATPLILALVACAESPLDRPADRIPWLMWTEKYQTYYQDENGELHSTDNIFLAEVGYFEEKGLAGITAKLAKGQQGEHLASFGVDDLEATSNDVFYTRKTKSFDTLHELEAYHPENGSYEWTLEWSEGSIKLDPVYIGGPERKTQLPI